MRSAHVPLRVRSSLVRSPLLLFAAVAAGYAAGSQLAFSWFGADGTNASFFPSAGVSLAALVLVRRRRWPIVLAAVATSEFLLDRLHGIDVLPTLGYVAANTVEPLAGALLLTTFVSTVDLGRTRDLTTFLVCAVVAGPAIGAAVGATTYVVLAQGEGWSRFAGEWLVGDGLGVLVVAGSLLALRTKSVSALGSRRLGEALTLTAVALVATVVVFWFEWLPLAYLPIALLVVTAFRVGTVGVALTGAGIAFLAAEATSEGHTFWNTLDISASTGLLYLQLSLGILIASSLALAAEIGQRERAAAAWASAEAARYESDVVAAHAERLRSLAESVANATTEEEVASVLAAHGFEGVVTLPPSAAEHVGSERYVRESAGRIARDAYARLGLLRQEREARVRAELLERHAAVLAAATTIEEVAASTVSALSRAGVGIVGVELLGGDTVDVVAVTGVSQAARQRFSSYPLAADTPGAAAMRAGSVVEVRSGEEYDSRFPATADLRASHGVEAVLAIPLRDTRGRVVGALSGAVADSDVLDAGARQLLVGVAEQTGLALERAAAFVAEQEARARAEELERRASRLQKVTAALAAARTTAELGCAVVSELIPAVGGMGGSIFVYDEEASVLRLIESEGFPDEVVDQHRVVPVDAAVPIAEAFRAGRPLLLRDVAELRAVYPQLLAEPGAVESRHGAAWADLPLVAGSRKVGHLAIAFPTPREFDARERAHLLAATDAAGQALARAMLYEAERDARWRAQLLERHATQLAAAATVQEVAECTVADLEGLGTVSVSLLDGDVVSIVASTGIDAGAQPKRRSRPLSASNPAAEAMRSARPVEIASARDYDGRYPDGASASRRRVIESTLAMPLLAASGRVLGALEVSSDEPSSFTTSIRNVVTGIAEQTGLALERAQLHERAELAAVQSAFLVRLGEVLERGTSASARAEALVRLLHAELGVVSAIRLLDDADSGQRLVAESQGWSEALEAPWSAVPLRARGRTLGMLEVRGSTDVATSELGREIASRAAVALDNALLYEREREVSHTLQLGLLGGSLARAEGVELAAAYRAGTAALDVGGDWYDAFELPSGSLALVVGDVVGHGLDAAIVMGQLRGAVRALAPANEPARLLEHLDTFVETLPDAGMATIAYVELEPSSGRLRFACAGHPPPLVVCSDGASRFLWEGRSAAIGSVLGAVRAQAEAELEAGETLVLYTDGVVERRSESLDVGLERLARVAGSPASPNELVVHIPNVMLEGQTQDDDVCLLVARRVPVEARLLHSFRASPAELAPLRARLRSWLQEHEVEDGVIADTVLAISEAAANSVEHGLGFDESGTVSVEARLGDGRLELSVVDDGRWREVRDDPDRGYGFHIIETVMDGVSVERRDSGTVVRMHCSTSIRAHA